LNVFGAVFYLRGVQRIGHGLFKPLKPGLVFIGTRFPTRYCDLNHRKRWTKSHILPHTPKRLQDLIS